MDVLNTWTDLITLRVIRLRVALLSGSKAGLGFGACDLNAPAARMDF
jgi:hypothetical protein